MNRDIIVIGASAGGLEALKALVGHLPEDLKAAVFVVLHLPPWHDSKLPSVLEDNGPLPASHAVDRESIEAGHIYVAPPDRHLMLDDHHMQLWRGPKENGHRPSVNPLFRSAAVRFGPRVAGVILSGALDDGVAGLWMVKREGGIAIVQDPEEASVPAMPLHAMEYVRVDYMSEAAQIGDLLQKLAGNSQMRSGTDRKDPIGRN
ncbi:MAG TPA: chemotaxis protein CheB [Bryobacteraceae bacterium]